MLDKKPWYEIWHPMLQLYGLFALKRSSSAQFMVYFYTTNMLSYKKERKKKEKRKKEKRKEE